MNTKLFVFIFLISAVLSIDLSKWERYDQNIVNLGFYGTDMRKVAYQTYTNKGYPLYYWSSQKWVSTGSDKIGIKFTVGYNHEWYITRQSEVNRKKQRNCGNMNVNCKWETLSIVASDISIATSDTTDPPTDYVWIVSPTDKGDRMGLYDGASGNVNYAKNNEGVRVAAAPDGKAWGLTSTGAIKKYDGDSWVTVPGEATDITVAPDGTVYILTKTPAAGGYTIGKWDSATSTWVTVPGLGGVSLAVDNKNNLVVVSDEFEVYRQRDIESIFCPVCKKDCSSCQDNDNSITCNSCRITLCMPNGNNFKCKICPEGKYPNKNAQSESEYCLACPAHCTSCRAGNTGNGEPAAVCLSCDSSTHLKNGVCYENQCDCRCNCDWTVSPPACGCNCGCQGDPQGEKPQGPI